MDTDHPKFHLRVTDDGIAVLLDCTVSNEELEGLLAGIESELSELGVVDTPSSEQLEEQLRRAADGGAPIVNEVLVKGQLPAPPKDGVLEWTEDFFRSDFAVDEKTGAVDYRQKAAHMAVEEGQLLARLIRPEEGRPGRNVFGESIPAESPKQPRVSTGPNVRMEEKEDALHYYATANGRIRWAMETLAVDDVYTIKGDVCLETGHIDHPGTVVVRGDVLTGFKVRAEGNIEIMGIVEPADIEAGGDLTVHGGITGTEDHSIKAAGNSHAKYILDANVEAGEDIVVENEIIHSKLKALGAVIMPGGRLIGGEVSALRGIVVRQAGSDAHVPTLLVTAEDHSLAEKLRSKKEEVASLSETLKKIHEKVDPLTSHEDKLSPKQREIVSALLSKASEMEKAIKRLHTEMDDLKAESKKRGRSKISVKDKMYPETTLRIKETALLADEISRGPLTAVLEHGEITLKAGSLF